MIEKDNREGLYLQNKRPNRVSFCLKRLINFITIRAESYGKRTGKEGKAKGKWDILWVGWRPRWSWVGLFSPTYSFPKSPTRPLQSQDPRRGGRTEMRRLPWIPGRRSFAGIPPLAKCLECHESAQGDKKEEAAFIKVGRTIKKGK